MDATELLQRNQTVYNLGENQKQIYERRWPAKKKTKSWQLWLRWSSMQRFEDYRANRRFVQENTKKIQNKNMKTYLQTLFNSS